MKNLSLIIIILHLTAIFGCNASSAGESKTENNVEQFSQSDMSMPIYITHYPLTNDYYNQFMNSQVEFPSLEFDYRIRPTPDYPNLSNQWLAISIRVEVVSGHYTDFTLSQIDEFSVFYHDLDDHPLAVYESNLESSWIMPVFSLIQQHSDYYFSGDEYGEEESLKLSSNLQFGYINYISLSIETPNRSRGIINPHYTFCKGWNPDEDPPAELVPLIEYLESVIMPEMLNHPCDW